MTVLSRDVLAKAFPNNPRLVAELEALEELLAAVPTQVEALNVAIAAAQEALAAINAQPLHALLTAITELNGEAGALEIVDIDQVNARPIDGEDDASLLTRGMAATLFEPVGP